MTDKEVGELWHFYNEYNPGEEKGKQIRALIRKLVEERTNIIGCLHREGYRDVPLREDRRGWVNYDTEALKDFGIDPKTWKEST